MHTTDFTTTITVEQSAEAAFKAINNVRGWWSEEITGGTEHVGDEFKYHFEDVHNCHIRISEVIPGKKVIWEVLDNYFKFTQDQTEWGGTNIIFEITEKDQQTEIRFTHKGLQPADECYDICSKAWTTYIQTSLRNLILTGQGQPNGKEKPTTEDEQRFGSTQQ